MAYNDSNKVEGFKRKDHPDYQSNLESANKFIQKTEKSLLRGMKVRISDSEHLPKSLLMFSWTPPEKSLKGRCATPVFLHQKSDDFKKEAEDTFKIYMKVVGDYEKAHPSQPELIDTTKLV